MAVRDTFMVGSGPEKCNVWQAFDPPDPTLSVIAAACHPNGDNVTVAIWWDYLRPKPPRSGKASNQTTESSSSSSSSSNTNKGSGKEEKKSKKKRK